jgi:hypothetical protein
VTRSSYRFRVWLCLGLAAAAPAVARAATPTAEARKAANAAVDAAFAGFKVAEKQARDALDADLTAFETTVVAPADPVAVAPAFGAPIASLQVDLTDALDAALEQAAAAHSDAMTAFRAATAEPFPRDLLAGGGGAADRLREGLRTAAAKSLAKARKRLAKTTAVLQAAGLRTLVRLEVPRPKQEVGPNVAGTIPVGEPPLTIDVLVAMSVADPIAGGVVFASGQCRASIGDVEASLDGSDGQSATTTPDGETNRWTVFFGAPDLVDAGGEVLVVRQGTGAATTAAIGVP